MMEGNFISQPGLGLWIKQIFIHAVEKNKAGKGIKGVG
jgi:hypothetical protein